MNVEHTSKLMTFCCLSSRSSLHLSSIKEQRGMCAPWWKCLAPVLVVFADFAPLSIFGGLPLRGIINSYLEWMHAVLPINHSLPSSNIKWLVN